jgi:hypothetical protein
VWSLVLSAAAVCHAQTAPLPPSATGQQPASSSAGPLSPGNAVPPASAPAETPQTHTPATSPAAQKTFTQPPAVPATAPNPDDATSPATPAQDTESQSTGSPLPGVEAFEGKKVTGIGFNGVTASMLDPLPSQLELQPGDTLDDRKVRASLRRLYQSGLYDSIEVQGIPSPEGVTVVFAGRPRLFIGRTQIFGVKNDQLQAQLVAAERLQPGTRYSQRKLDASLASIQNALTENGFYEAKVERREQLDAANIQVNVIYNITPGRQARIGQVKV